MLSPSFLKNQKLKKPSRRLKVMPHLNMLTLKAKRIMSMIRKKKNFLKSQRRSTHRMMV
jgi:hypothetical protein